MNTRMPLEEPRERVLIVDDAPSITMLLSRILQAEGYLCTSAGTIGDAKMTLRRSHFDVMLCDVQLPDGSGLDLVERAIAHDDQLAALVVSGLDEVALGDHALRIGAAGDVSKPFSANDVLIGVRGALAHRRRELRARTAIREASEETIQRLCAAVEARDTGTAAHVSGMSEHCYAIARELGLDTGRCDLLRAASPMHDIGKVGVPDRI